MHIVYGKYRTYVFKNIRTTFSVTEKKVEMFKMSIVRIKKINKLHISNARISQVSSLIYTKNILNTFPKKPKHARTHTNIYKI